MIVWHYTILEHLRSIQADGVIVPGGTENSPFIIRRHKQAVWFSSDPVWEATAGPAFFDSSFRRVERTWQDMQRNVGIGRIGVEPHTAPYRWSDWKRMSGATAKEARKYYIAAMKFGGRPGDWFLTFDAVPSAKWVSLEIHDGHGWVADAQTAVAA
jgi:hypothetical protein